MLTNTYELSRREIRDNYRKYITALRAHRPLFNIAHDIGKKWSSIYGMSSIMDNQGRSYYILAPFGAGVLNCVSLDLYLGPKDSINKDIAILLEEIATHPKLSLATGMFDTWVSIDSKSKEWNFVLETNEPSPWTPKLKVRAYFERSNICKLVGTGEFKEIMEVKCD